MQSASVWAGEGRHQAMRIQELCQGACRLLGEISVQPQMVAEDFIWVPEQVLMVPLGAGLVQSLLLPLPPGTLKELN